VNRHARTISLFGHELGWGKLAALGVIGGGLSLALLWKKSFKVNLLVSYFWRGLVTAYTGVPVEVRLINYVFEHATEGDPESVVRTIDEFAHNKHWMMNVGDRKGSILDEEVKKHAPKVMLEFGAYCGYSAVRIARLLPEDAKLYSIEYNPHYAAIATKIIEHAGLQHKVKVIVGTVEEKLGTLKAKYGVEKVDMIFIDHWKIFYLPDIKRVEAAKLLRKGTVVVADNIITPGAPDYLKYVQTSPNYETTVHNTTLEYSHFPDAVAVSLWVGDE